jgi:hypothetical protein
MSDTPTSEPWQGWHRASKRDPWQQLCQHVDYDACWGLLLSLAPRGGELLVTKDDPNRTGFSLHAEKSGTEQRRHTGHV